MLAKNNTTNEACKEYFTVGTHAITESQLHGRRPEGAEQSQKASPARASQHESTFQCPKIDVSSSSIRLP